MNRTLAMPGKYVQGPGVLDKIGELSAPFGRRALLMGGPNALSVSQAAITKSLRDVGLESLIRPFRGECTAQEIDRLTQIAQEEGANLVIGVGGGKALDTAKGVAHYLAAPMVSVPTVASTDGAASGVVGMYTEDHAPMESALMVRGNPNVVLVDSEVILRSPLRYTMAGIGDALSTNVEAEACVEASATNVHGESATSSAIACAKLCHELVVTHSLGAKESIEQGVLSEAFEKILEASILLSGVGFENCGLSIAHALWLSFSRWAAFRKIDVYHGEAVALFTLVQLVATGHSRTYIEEIADLCASLGLPVTLADIGLGEIPGERVLTEAIEPAFFPGSTIDHVPIPVDAKTIYSGFRELEEIAALRK